MDEDALVNEYAGLIESSARNFVYQHRISMFDIEDVKQELYMALVRAARKFKPNQGTKFSTYLIRSMHSALADLQKYCGVRYRLSHYSSLDELLGESTRPFQIVDSSKQPKTTHKSYTPELKINAVKDLLKGKNIRDVAKTYDTTTSQLRLWKKSLLSRARQMNQEAIK